MCQETAYCTDGMHGCQAATPALTLAPFALATLTVLSELPPSTTRTSDTPLSRTLQEQQHSIAQLDQADIA
jgi:hypothetical protein